MSDCNAGIKVCNCYTEVKFSELGKIHSHSIDFATINIEICKISVARKFPNRKLRN